MKHVIQHDLDEATARKVIDKAFAAYQARFPSYDPTLTWVTAKRAELGMKAMGASIGGEMTIEQGAIAVDLNVPLLLRPFKAKALEVIEREVAIWVEKAKSGQL